MSAHRTGRVRRAVLAVCAVVLAISILAEAVPSDAQQVGPPVGTMPAGGELGFTSQFGFGTNTFGLVDAAEAPYFVDSVFDLTDVDVFSGMLLPESAATPLSPDLAITHDLMAADALAFDALALAAEAQRQAALAKARAQAKARAEGVAFESAANPGEPEPWELKQFSDCGGARNATFQARIETVDMFEIMCRAAEADGVALKINSAWRDPAHQRRLWADALGKYGSAAVARKWVAQPTADGSCTSRHCAGVAIDVTNAGDSGRAWMHTVIGCYTTAGTLDRTRTSCGSGERPVKRVQIYGFVLPMAHEPWHIQVGIPISTNVEGGGAVDGSCDPPRSYSVPQMVAAIFRCRLSEAGIGGEEQETIVREALVVSHCESGWNAEAVVFGGRYLNTPHPRTGLRYSAAGVFQFIRSTADGAVAGGYANVKDPVANIDAAAKVYLKNRSAGRRGWADWACAMVNDGFAKKSVVPGYPNGPSGFPDWAYAY